MFGWFKAETARTSRWNRFSAWASPADQRDQALKRARIAVRPSTQKGGDVLGSHRAHHAMHPNSTVAFHRAIRTLFTQIQKLRPNAAPSGRWGPTGLCGVETQTVRLPALEDV